MERDYTISFRVVSSLSKEEVVSKVTEGILTGFNMIEIPHTLEIRNICIHVFLTESRIFHFIKRIYKWLRYS